jgi:hypothetical protein
MNIEAVDNNIACSDHDGHFTAAEIGMHTKAAPVHCSMIHTFVQMLHMSFQM